MHDAHSGCGGSEHRHAEGAIDRVIAVGDEGGESVGNVGRVGLCGIDRCECASWLGDRVGTDLRVYNDRARTRADGDAIRSDADGIGEACGKGRRIESVDRRVDGERLSHNNDERWWEGRRR